MYDIENKINLAVFPGLQVCLSGYESILFLLEMNILSLNHNCHCNELLPHIREDLTTMLLLESLLQ